MPGITTAFDPRHKTQPGRAAGCRRILWVIRIESSTSRGNQLLLLVNGYSLMHFHAVTNKDGFAVTVSTGESLLLFFSLLHPDTAPGALHPDRAVPPRGLSEWLCADQLPAGLNHDKELI